MSRSLTSVLAALVFVVPGIVGGYWGLLYFSQRWLIYPRPPLDAMPPRPADAEQVWLETSTGRVEAWYLRPLSRRAKPAPLLLFTHGNGEAIDQWPALFVPPRQWGFGVLLLEYPGYGRSAGEPSEASITETALAAYDWAASRDGIDPRRIIPYGRSLGGGAACAIAANRPVAGLILESCFTSLRPFARTYGAPTFLLRDVFDSLAALQRYRGPLLVLHGEGDDIIPAEAGRELAAAVPGSEFEALPCGHNDCERPWDRIRRFLQTRGLLPE